MPKPKRGRAEDDQPTLAGGSAAVRAPGESSSADAGIPPDAPTLVDFEKIRANSPPPPRLSPVARRTTTPGEPENTPILEPQSVLGQRYEILELLGQGGMGAVYKARDREVNQLVALKVIRPDLARNPAIIERFKQELILARQVTHKNVIRIYDLAEADGVKFITMEYVEGEDLRSLIHETKKLVPAEAVEIMRQVCLALEAAHNVGVIHRDLKPQNIMRDKTGRVLVMDFGLARTIEGGGMTQSGAMVGTLEYMSPEQARAEKLDARSDLFTIGLIFYELLTGKTPFKADSAIASLLKRTQEPAPPAYQADPSVPRALSDILGKCLERDPAQRFQSVQELLDRLDEYQGKRPVSGITTAPPVPRKNWMVLAAAAVVVLVIAVAISVWLLRGRTTTTATTDHARPPVTVLVADFGNTTSDAVFDATLEPSFILALEGAPFINAYSRPQARKIEAQLKPGATTLDEKDARLVAAREGIAIVIGGSIAKSGEAYKITCRAADARTGKTVSSESVDAVNKSEVLQAIGTLAGRMRSALGDSTPESVKLAQAETFTSASLEAAHAYAQAQDLRSLGKYDEAIQVFLKAIELDPNFGSAYGSVAAVYWNRGNHAEGVKYYKLALQHIDRMTDREKYRTRGGYYLAVADGDKAVEEFSALEKQFPADSMGLSALAHAYYLKHDMAHASEASSRAMQIYPKNAVYRNNAALYAIYADDYDSAIKDARAVQEINPGFPDGYITEALAETGKGDYNKAVELWHKVETLGGVGPSAAANGLSDLDLFRGHPAEAIPVLEKGIAADTAAKDTAAAAKKYVVIAESQLMAGNKGQAMQPLQRAVTMDKAAVLFPAGHQYALLGEDRPAMAMSATLSQEVDPMPQARGKLIEGEVQLSHGHAKEAIKLFQESLRISDTWLGHFDLARAYLDAGAFTESNTELETCLKRRGETADIYLDEQQSLRYFPPTYYYLGRALEGMKSAGAADAYRSFLALKAADARDPLVIDARKRAGH